MWTDNLRQFHFWCQKTLPLVYDDSLSYYEVLAKVTKHLNELTTLVNEIGDELERYEGVTDDRLDTLETWRTEVDTWRAQIDQWKTIVENWREDVDQWREDIDQWKTSINNWKAAVNLELENLDSRLDTAESDIDSLEGRMDTAEDDIDNLEGRMNTAEDDIDTLQSDVTSLDGRLDDAETAITGLDGRLGIVEDDIVSLDSRLDDAESVITGLDDRLDTAEDDIDTLQSDTTGLANRMSTAEDDISKIEERAFIIFGIVTYDSANNIWLLEIGSPWDATFIRTNVDNSDYLLSAVSKKTQFIFSIGSSGYNYDNLVLSYGSTPLQYNGQNVVINISRPGTNSIWYTDFDSSADTFILDTMPSNFAKINRFVSSNTLSMPKPTQNDDGKVVAYNDTLKNYELITPPSPTVSHNYSTTEQVVGTWIDNSPVYEKTVPVTINSGTNSSEIILGFGITNLISFDLIVGYSDAGFRRSYNNTLQATGNYATNGMCWVGVCRLINQNSISVMLGATTDRVYTGYAVLRYTK